MSCRGRKGRVRGTVKVISRRQRNFTVRHEVGQIGHLPCPNVLFWVSQMITETTSNLGHKEPRGWDALEVKLKAKGLSAGEIAQARKSFYDGIETLTKMFLSTQSTSQLRAKEAQESFE